MNKDNILFGVIGLLLGLIIGFVFANKTNQSGMTQQNPGTNTAMSNPNMPADHPAIDPQQQAAAMMPQVNEAIKIADAEPNNFEAQMKVAAMFYQIQNYNKAVEFLLRANKIKPEDYDSITQLGHANYDAGNFVEAEKWYVKALAKKPEDVAVRTDMASTFVLRNPPDLDRAIKEYTGSLQYNPNHEQTLDNLTRAYIRKGDFQKAKEFLERLEKAAPGNENIAGFRTQIEKQGKS